MTQKHEQRAIFVKTPQKGGRHSPKGNRIPGQKYAARQPWAQAALQEIPPICRWAGVDEVVISPESQSSFRSYDPSGSSTMWGFSQQTLGRAAKPRGFAGKLRSDASVPEKKGGRRARSGPAAGTHPL